MHYGKYVAFAVCSMLAACQNSNDNTEDRLVALEKQNAELQQRLLEEKTAQQSKKSAESVQPPVEIENLTAFQIGSPEAHVLQVMGTPTSVREFEMLGEKWLEYGLSTVTIKNGRVSGYNNLSKNLSINASGTRPSNSANYMEQNNQELQTYQYSNMASPNQQSRQTPKAKASEYVYFTFSKEGRVEYIGGHKMTNYDEYCTKIFKVSAKNSERIAEIKACLLEQQKHTGARISLTPHRFKSLSEATAHLEMEDAYRIAEDVFCDTEF